MVRFRIRIIRFAVLVLMGNFPAMAQAFSLGELQRLSKPNETFQAAAAIKLSEDEKITSLDMGTQSDYGLLNLPYDPVVENLSVRVKKQDGKPFVWLQGVSPVATKDFYILLRISSNRHTYFPFFRIQTPVEVAEKPLENSIDPVEVAAETLAETVPALVDSLQRPSPPLLPPPLKQPVVVENTPPLPQEKATKNNIPPAKPPQGKQREVHRRSNANKKTYGPIKNRENLTEVARMVKPGPSVSIFQVLVAIWKYNPDKFIRNNMNGLKKGKILVIPTVEQMARIDNQEAKALRLNHALVWQKNRTADEQEEVAQPMPQESPLVLFSPAARQELSHAPDLDGTPNNGQNKVRPKESNQSENGNLQAILQQLQIITNVLENNRVRSDRLDKRLSAIERSKREWDLLQNRVNQLEISRQAVQNPVELPKMDQNQTLIEKKWLLWGGVGMAGFGLVGGFFLLWLARRWNRTDHWNNLRALLSNTAQNNPDLLVDALKENEPVFGKEFTPTIYNQALKGIAPQPQKQSLAGNLTETANKLKTVMEQKE